MKEKCKLNWEHTTEKRKHRRLKELVNLQEKFKENRKHTIEIFLKKMVDLQMLDGMDATQPIIHYGNE